MEMTHIQGFLPIPGMIVTSFYFIVPSSDFIATTFTFFVPDAKSFALLVYRLPFLIGALLRKLPLEVVQRLGDDAHSEFLPIPGMIVTSFHFITPSSEFIATTFAFFVPRCEIIRPPRVLPVFIGAHLRSYR
ncbi:hypothetical protein ABES80_07370 [Bacillus gobiensis]|uniref:hypothetical protein n=1 Tax=Bacillus gobiensis TaxID=1441095 RepID=UPI003D2539D3